MDIKEEKEWAKKILGSVEMPNDGSKYLVDLELIKLPFERAESVVYCFCENCASYIEADQGSADELCRLAKTGLRNDFRNSFFSVGECVFCSDNEEYKGVKINHIAQ